MTFLCEHAIIQISCNFHILNWQIMWLHKSMPHIYTHIFKFITPHSWCKCKRAHFESGRSWVQAQVGPTKDYIIGICCFFAKHAALRRKSKDWLARNQDNVSLLEQRVFKSTTFSLLPKPINNSNFHRSTGLSHVKQNQLSYHYHGI